MQANQLWSGNDYAWAQHRPKSSFPMAAKRVRVVRVFQEKDRYYDERAKTYVQVNFVDDEGNLTLRDGKEIVKTVRARDFTDHWQHYVDERDEITRKAKERQRIYEEQRAQEDARDQAIVDYLVKIGVPEDSISKGYGNFINISKEVIWEWMKAQSQAVDSR